MREGDGSRPRLAVIASEVVLPTEFAADGAGALACPVAEDHVQSAVAVKDDLRILEVRM